MSRLVAFLRGINLGGRRVKTDELRGHFQDLDLDDVDSFLASGNVIFLREKADEDTRRRLDGLATDDDRFVAEGREVVWLRRGGLKKSTISMRDLEGALGKVDRTMRNLNTMERIVGKFGG